MEHHNFVLNIKFYLKDKPENTRVFDEYILPIFTYACQTWTLTKANMDKIVKTQRVMERSILVLRLRDKKQNNWIRKQIKVQLCGPY